MKILHLTDLHFKDTTAQNYNITKIVEKIYEENKDKGITHIFFTGDLVFSGNDLKEFMAAKVILIDTLSVKLGIATKNIFISAGNHDVHRNQEMPVITDTLSKLKSEEALNKFLSDKNQLQSSLENIKNYIQFQKTFYESNVLDTDESDKISPLYTVHKRMEGSNELHIVSINSAWRSNDSDTDSGNLLFPSKLLKEIIATLPKNSFKILLLHHPITDFKNWNRVELENVIYDDFNVLFLGHVHRSLNSTIIKNSDGVVCISSDATLSNINHAEHIGYSVVDVIIEQMQVYVQRFRIDSDMHIYQMGEKLNMQIPVDQTKRLLLDFRLKITRLYNQELPKAAKIFVSNVNSSSDLDELFGDPILKTTSATSLNSVAKKNNTSKRIFLKDIITHRMENYFIYGKDKFGKTSILYYLYVSYLYNPSKYKILPLYIDCGKKHEGNTIEEIFIREYQINKSLFEHLQGQYTIKILLDDYNKAENELKISIDKFFIKYSEAAYVATLDENILSDFRDVNIDSKPHLKLYIHNLTSVQVRNITVKTLNCDVERTEEILDKIKTIFKQLNLPLNYWTISLFLYVFSNSSEQNFNNNFELIQLYIDSLLDRQNIVTNKDIKIEYETLKIFLSELAMTLVKNYHQKNYQIKYAELVYFIEDYRGKNRRFVISTEALLTLIIEKGIVKEVDVEHYTFRLKGVFEYFIAYYLKDNESARDEVINDNHFYLSFGNELELVSGFNKRDSEFLRKIYEKSLGIIEPINKHYQSQGNTDQVLVKKSTNLSLKLSNVRNGVEAMSKRGSDNPKDDLFPHVQSDSEVTQKKMYDSIKGDSDHIEKVLFILSRVYRNSASADDQLNYNVLDLILESACNLCFLIIDEKDAKDDFEESFLKIFTNFIPLVIENFLFDALAQNNLENIFLDKIEELKQTSGNELKIFVLYYLLIDLDLKSNKKYIPILLSFLKLNVLKHASFYKLISYLLFKRYNSDHNRQIIESSVIEQAKLIDKSSEHIKNTYKTLQTIASRSLQPGGNKM